MKLNANITVESINDNKILFNTFSGDTHFIDFPFSIVVEQLSKGTTEKVNLYHNFCSAFDSPPADIKDFFEDAISKAIKSGIILAT